MRKRLIAMLLALCLVVAMVPMATVASFAKEEEGNVFHYVEFGASNSNGFGLNSFGFKVDGFMDLDELRAKDTDTYGELLASVRKDGSLICGFDTEIEGAYPLLFRDILEENLAGTGYSSVELKQYAQSGMRMEELRFLLDSDYAGDAYTKWRFYDNTSGTAEGWFPDIYNNLLATGSDLETLREIYRDAVREADLVVMDLGMNNFGVYLSNQLIHSSYDTDLANIYGEEAAEKFYSCREELKDVIISALSEVATEAEIREVLNTVEPILDTFAYTYLGFVENYKTCLELMREMNPTVEVICLGMQNILDGLTLVVDEYELPIGTIYGTVIQLANAAALGLSLTEDNVLYIDTVRDGNVDTLLTDLKNYDGETISESLRNLADVFDNSLFTDYRIRKYLEEKGYTGATLTDLTEKTEDIVYHILARLFKAGADTEVIDLEETLYGEDYIKMMTGKNYSLYKDAADAVINGQEFDSDAYVDAVLAKEGALSILAYNIRFSIGNCYAAHPSEAGHRQIAELLWERSKDVVFRKTYQEQSTEIVTEHVSKIRSLVSGLKEKWEATVITEKPETTEEAIETFKTYQEAVNTAVKETAKTIQSAVESGLKAGSDLIKTASSVRKTVLEDRARSIMDFWKGFSSALK